MSKPSLPPEPQLEQLFVALNGQRGLRQRQGSAPIMFADILHYVRGSSRVDCERVEAAINSDLRCRRLFSQLVTSQRRAFAPREARADDSSTVSSRETRAFSLKFRASKADVRQIYVILSVTAEADVAEGSAVTLLAAADDRVRQLKFPPLHDGHSQLILLQDDERLSLLRDAETELSLV